MERSLVVAHSLPGRVRLRLWRGALHDPEAVQDAAERLRRLKQVDRIDFHRTTGSVIVHYDPDRFAERELIESARKALGIEKVFFPGERVPPPTELAVVGTRLARAVAVLFDDLNTDLYRASRGTVDLRILMPLTFGALGVAEVVVTRKLPAPPWFNLMWWSFRAFTTLNAEAIAHARDERVPGPGPTPERPFGPHRRPR